VLLIGALAIVGSAWLGSGFRRAHISSYVVCLISQHRDPKLGAIEASDKWIDILYDGP
jgi:hypothetical protein